MLEIFTAIITVLQQRLLLAGNQASNPGLAKRSLFQPYVCCRAWGTSRLDGCKRGLGAFVMLIFSPVGDVEPIGAEKLTTTFLCWAPCI
jgi:hypothetical protein